MKRLMHSLFLFLILTSFAGVSVASPAAAETQKKARSSGQYQKWLEKEVRHELVMLPYFSVFDNLAFRVNGATVELTGQVVRPSLRSEAERVVKEIEGVEQVVNKIEVLPLSPMDDQLRRALYRAIYGDLTLSRYSLQAVPPIHIIVKHGHVTLEGVVGDETEKNVAALRANGVSNVFSVTNNLRVEG